MGSLVRSDLARDRQISLREPAFVPRDGRAAGDPYDRRVAAGRNREGTKRDGSRSPEERAAEGTGDWRDRRNRPRAGPAPGYGWLSPGSDWPPAGPAGAS